MQIKVYGAAELTQGDGYPRLVPKRGKPFVAVKDDGGVIRVHPIIIVPDCLWNTPHWDMPLPAWINLDNVTPGEMFAAAAVALDGSRRIALAEIEGILLALDELTVLAKNVSPSVRGYLADIGETACAARKALDRP